MIWDMEEEIMGRHGERSMIVSSCIYIAICSIAYFAVRQLHRPGAQWRKASDFTSLKTVTFGDESAVTA